MNYPTHLLRLQPASHSHATESVRLVTRTDVQWGTPVFRAPALPTPLQFSNELPFTVNFRGKVRSHA